MKLYTKGGDQGQTAIIGGRVSKDDPRVEAYGTMDELNSFVGLVVAELEQLQSYIEQQVAEDCNSEELWLDLHDSLIQISHELFDCGSDIAYADPLDHDQLKIKSEAITILEQWIDRWTEEAPALTKFILPGGSKLAAHLHVCRTICRRAERQVVTLAREVEVSPAVLIYLNRLSDYFFAAARVANARLDVADIVYERSANVFRLKGK
ncbi:cob(I)yrinic acid a,c-diamide adenosyltransferase [Paenibacillus yanchengensis]|uniref:Corrinoid adenosyltransferase n=1 Tax=Paenibacillus yanchengensis TaxID=2035833 RepID=A0ABW4YM17_9BACL